MGIKNFVKGLYVDGHKVLSIVAPLLSIAVSLVKAFDLGFANISYAWALVPITVWMLVAYWRRLIYSEDLEIRLIPKISVGEPVISHAKMGMTTPVLNAPPPVPADFVHLVVENSSGIPVTNCKAYIQAIRRNHVGKIESPPIALPIPLVTAGEHQPSATAHAGMPLHFDLAWTESKSNKFGLAPSIRKPFVIEADFFEPAAIFEFDLRIVADNSVHVDAVIRIYWRYEWDKLRVEKLR
jgi:hypothetical protein